MRVSDSVFGALAERGKLCLLLGLLFSLALQASGCSSSGAAMAAKARLESAEMESESSSSPRLPRPRRASGVTLRTWLAAKDSQASLQRINDCQAQLLSLAENARQQPELRLLAKKLRADVATELKLYHFCYYHLLMRLEEQLEQDKLGFSLKERLQTFMGEYRALWILAIALDHHTEQNYYRSVARRNYMELSQVYFGRSLSPAPGTAEPEDEEAEEGTSDEEEERVPGDEDEAAEAPTAFRPPATNAAPPLLN